MNEIKLEHHTVEKAIDRLTQATLSLDASINKDVKGENILELVDRFTKLNQSLDEVLKMYQELSLQNAHSTKMAVESMKEVERLAAGRIQITY